MRVSLLTPSGRRAQLDLDDPNDHISRRIIGRRAWYEHDLLTDIQTRVKSGLVLDIGAHIGNHTIYLAMAGLNVMAFEPNPLTREQLIRNVKLNELHDRVQVVPAAVGSESGHCKLNIINPANTGMTQTVLDDAGDIPVTNIDSLGVAPSCIKIDVEGAELPILHGARHTLTTHHPILYIEAATDEAKRQVDNFLIPLGYSCFGRFALTPTYGYHVQNQEQIKLSVSIMAHPARKALVKKLINKLDSPATVVWDQIQNRWDTGRRSLLAHDPTATHHLVLQDDALICRDLTASLTRALGRNLHCPTSLYLGRQRPNGPRFSRATRMALEVGANWILSAELCWGVGLCFPTSLISPMIAYCDRLTTIDNYDRRLAIYLSSRRIPTWYTLPSLVDHRRQSVSPSLVPGRYGQNRVAQLFIGERKSGLQIDWMTGDLLYDNRVRSRTIRKCPVCSAANYACST